MKMMGLCTKLDEVYTLLILLKPEKLGKMFRFGMNSHSVKRIGERGTKTAMKITS